MKKNRKRTLKLVSELLCLALAFCMIFGSLPTIAEETDATQTEAAKTVAVIKASKDIPRGTRITDEYLETVTVYNRNVPKNVISEPVKIISQYAKEDIAAGDYISSDMISTKAVNKANSELLLKDIEATKDEYVIVTNFIKPNTGEDVSSFIQELIDENPNKLIYFPDGEYLISYPICTSAAGKTSSGILLSDGAVIKASDNWKSRNGNGALICLGGSVNANDINTVGSYYTLSGGTLDGNGRAYGVQIVSGRESVIRNMCIKNTKIGIIIDRGANNGSSDCDFEDLTIIGEGKSGTVGVRVDGWDNTFTNIRIFNMAKGFECYTTGNLIKSIYVINTIDNSLFLQGTTGIYSNGNNWISECYVENCTTAYSMRLGSEIWDCVAKWTNDSCKNQTAFSFNGSNITVSGCYAQFFNADGITTSLVSDLNNDLDERYDFIEGTAVKGTITDETYKKYLRFDIPVIEVK